MEAHVPPLVHQELVTHLDLKSRGGPRGQQSRQSLKQNGKSRIGGLVGAEWDAVAVDMISTKKSLLIKNR